MWTKTDSGYVSEMSTLECNNALRCPKCGYDITLGQPIREKDGEIIKWSHRCRDCGTQMIIFND